MEDLENEQDKIGYWLVFFVIILVLSVVGYFVVFYDNDNPRDDVEEEKTIIEDDKLDSYIGVWAIFTDDEDTPDSELCINVIDGSTVTFDYYVKNTLYFESKTAHLERDTASFEMTDEDGDVTLEGRFVFRNDKVFLILTSSSDDEVSLGTFEFVEKRDESILRNSMGE